MTALWLLCLPILSTGCASPPEPRLQTRIQIEQVAIPAELLTCQAAPAPPAVPYTQADVAAYIVDLHSAGADCRERLARIAALQNATQPKGRSTP
jgi:hypothetical protein